ncbi:hypothetical protein [Streptomyces sp. TP-A0874]|uniref:hypothetical protein n=1 Tax=Streptomyces sp. TP-A0874 TaxID=549819 RepID=UPI001112CB96|nr:hypothetical protein [Streptomyces sp. TP-A0874]
MTITAHAGRPALICSACRSVVAQPGIPVLRQARRHLAGHLADTPLPPHLRICQCRDHGCIWHRQPAPCSGPLRLLLICSANGRTWHLADTCRGCARAIPHAATVPEPPHATDLPPSPRPAAPDADHDEWVEAL